MKDRVLDYDTPLFIDYYALVRDWEGSPSIRKEINRGHRIGRKYVSDNTAWI